MAFQNGLPEAAELGEQQQAGADELSGPAGEALADRKSVV